MHTGNSPGSNPIKRAPQSRVSAADVKEAWREGRKHNQGSAVKSPPREG